MIFGSKTTKMVRFAFVNKQAPLVTKDGVTIKDEADDEGDLPEDYLVPFFFKFFFFFFLLSFYLFEFFFVSEKH
jgi:hypothetical protein